MTTTTQPIHDRTHVRLGRSSLIRVGSRVRWAVGSLLQALADVAERGQLGADAEVTIGRETGARV